MAAGGGPAGVREGGLQSLSIGECLARLATVWLQLLRVSSPLFRSTTTGGTDLCPLGGLTTQLPPGARLGTVCCLVLLLAPSSHALGLRPSYLLTVTTTCTVRLVLSGDLRRAAACSRAVLLARSSAPLTSSLCPRGHMTLVSHAHCNLQQHQRAGRASIKSTYM